MKKIVFGTLLSCVLLIPFSAFAEDNEETTNWVAGINYVHLSDALYTLDFNAVTGSIGYKFQTTDNFSLIPELRIGVGVSDNNDFGGDTDLERFVALSFRAQYQFDNDVYLFASPTYVNSKFNVSEAFEGETYTGSFDSWDFGYSGGVGYNFSDTTSAEIVYERIGGEDLFSMGIKFHF